MPKSQPVENYQTRVGALRREKTISAGRSAQHRLKPLGHKADLPRMLGLLAQAFIEQPGKHPEPGGDR